MRGMLQKKNPAVRLARMLRRGQTDAERNLWMALRDGRLSEVKFRRQQPIGNFVGDFVSFEKKLIIEVDGSQHATRSRSKEDATRTSWLESQGFRVIRFWDNDVLQNLEGVFSEIEHVLK